MQQREQPSVPAACHEGESLFTRSEPSLVPPSPTTQQLVHAAVHLVCHGPYASAQQRARLLHPVTDPICHNGAMQRAEVVLRTVVDAVFARLRPEDLAQLSQALARARDSWPPALRELDGGIHRRSE